MNDKQLRDDNGGIRIASLGLSSCDDALLWMTAALSMQCRAPLQCSIDGLLIQSPPLNNNKLSGEFHSIAITKPPIAISSLSPQFDDSRCRVLLLLLRLLLGLPPTTIKAMHDTHINLVRIKSISIVHVVIIFIHYGGLWGAIATPTPINKKTSAIYLQCRETTRLRLYPIYI